MGVLLQTVQTKRANQHEQPHIFLKNRIFKPWKTGAHSAVEIRGKRKKRRIRIYIETTRCYEATTSESGVLLNLLVQSRGNLEIAASII